MKEWFIKCCTIIIFMALAVPSFGATITVTETADNAEGSLRAAIDKANNNGEENVIYLAAGTYTLSGNPDEDGNQSGDLDIFPTGKLTIIGVDTSSTFIDGNQVDRVLHIISGAVSISNVTILDGKTYKYPWDGIGKPHGGGIYNAGTLQLTTCRIVDNETGPQFNRGHHGAEGGAGGGIYNEGTLTAVNCVIQGNQTAVGSMGLLHGAGGGKGGGIMNTGSLTISNSTITSNKAGDGATAGYSGYGGSGGGIYSSGSLVAGNCTFGANQTGNGGGNRPTWGTWGGHGGGLYIEKGNATLVQCTVTENTTGKGGGTSGGYKGGGGFGGGIYNFQGNVTLESCTISKNATGEGEQPSPLAGGTGLGGGIYNYGYNNGAVSMTNSILADNTVSSGGLGPDCNGAFISGGYNLVEDTAECTFTGVTTGHVTGVDPMLDYVAFNGGFTHTAALQTGSPAIDAGYSTNSTDQRGYKRIVDIAGIGNAGNGADIGAYEYNAPANPVLQASPEQLNAAAVVDGSQTFSQRLFIDGGGAGPFNWTLQSNTDWLGFSPKNGSGAAIVNVWVDPTGLAPGTYTGEISVICNEAINSPLNVTVALTVYPSGASAMPFGDMDTPLPDSTVYSSVPFTGWVLDDIGIESVKIYRDPLEGEGRDLIYIDPAVMVEGARPDVAALYPSYPDSSKAGWGYMMLTNFLPGQGNGWFTFYAIAADREGNEVTLGSRTVYADNQYAFKPFGAIDRPRPGYSISGASYVNFGWALTPRPNTIPFDGSTITVWVDGVARGNPVYNQYRKDIAQLFPGYNNSYGAVGYFYLDTTELENGVHTIAWSVKDDAGYADGIGSRYFTVLNPSSPKSNSNSTSSSHSYSYPYSSGLNRYTPVAVKIPAIAGPVTVLKGFRRDESPDTVFPEDGGLIAIETRELERFEINLSPDSLNSGPALEWTGYMVHRGKWMQLPPGSYLDRGNGIFYCQLGVGFVGKYRFVFIAEEAGIGKRKIRKDVSLTILPKFSLKY
jgi:hypothetical protein